jgi:hypothetical protein
MMLRQILGAVALLGLCAAGTATAGTFTAVSMQYSQSRPVPHITFEGPVVVTDLDDFDRVYRETVHCGTECISDWGGATAVVTLDSYGGNYLTGLALAEYFRAHRIATVVEASKVCYSACAFAFMGGTGWSGQDGIGLYVDRMIEPGGILGFHAPYVASDQLDGLVAELGLPDVLGGSREMIATMVEKLVGWNVDSQVIARMVGMGSEETYDVVTPNDLYLIRAALPPLPWSVWQPDREAAVRNACMRLIAMDDASEPILVAGRVPVLLERNVATNDYGEVLSGYRLGPDNPLGTTWCAVPTAQLDAGDDMDIGLYSAPGISGQALSSDVFWLRQRGWSSLRAGNRLEMSAFQKDAMSHYLLPPDMYLPDVRIGLSLLTDKFFSIGARDLPDSGLDMETLHEDLTRRVSRSGGVLLFEQAGSTALFDTAKAMLGDQGVTISAQSESDTAFYRAGTYADGSPFSWIGFRRADDSTVIRLEAPGGAWSPLDEALVRTVECGARFGDMKLSCN